MTELSLTSPIATAFYAGLLALLIFPMVILIIKRRYAAKIGLGSGRHDGLKEEQELLQAVRIHGNFIEYVPLILILMGLNEILGASVYLIHGLGISLLFARIIHAVGLYKSTGPSRKRQIGVLVTFACLAISAMSSIAMTALPVFEQLKPLFQ